MRKDAVSNFRQKENLCFGLWIENRSGILDCTLADSAIFARKSLLLAGSGRAVDSQKLAAIARAISVPFALA